jgi:transcriptional regulator with XRE-family HTH domain
MSMKEVGKYLRSLREDGKPSLRAVAARAGVTAAFLSKLELGLHESMELGTLRKVAAGYGVPVGKLLAIAGLTEDQPNPNLDVYLRTQYGLSDVGIQEVEAFIGYVRQRHGKNRPKK